MSVYCVSGITYQPQRQVDSIRAKCISFWQWGSGGRRLDPELKHRSTKWWDLCCFRILSRVKSQKSRSHFYCGRSLKSSEMTFDIATERFFLSRTWNMHFHLKLKHRVNFTLNCFMIMYDLLFIRNHIYCNVASSFRAVWHLIAIETCRICCETGKSLRIPHTLLVADLAPCRLILFLLSRTCVRDAVLKHQIPLKIFTTDTRAASVHPSHWWVKCKEFVGDYETQTTCGVHND